MTDHDSGARPRIPAFLLMLATGLFLVLVTASTTVSAQDDAGAVRSTILSPEQVEALSNLLRHEAARQALLQELQQLAEQPSETPEDATPPEETQKVSIVREIAETTQEAAEEIAARTIRFWGQLKRAPAALSAVGAVSPDVVIQALIDLALVAATTIVIFLVLRFAAKRLYRKMGAAVHEAGAVRTSFLIGLSILIDAGTVLLAWASGYAITLIAFGDLGAIGIRQTLFLNAFLIVEMVKVVLRAILSPSTEDLRPVTIPNRGARVLSGWMTLVISVLGYGQLLVVPIVTQNVGLLAGRSVATLVALLAIIILIGLTLAYRQSVAAWLSGVNGECQRTGLFRMLSPSWHVPVLLYLVFLFAIVLTRPAGILFPLLGASAQIAAAIVLGAIVSNLLRRAMAKGVHLPRRVNERLPLLERRLNTFVPQILYLLRFGIVIAVVAFTIHTIGLADVRAWLEGRVGVELSATILSVSFLLIVAFGFWLALSSWVDYRLNTEFGRVPTAREQTLLTLLRNAATVVIAVITLMFVLSEIGIDIAPLIASAGVLGLAIGFGAQKMVQDIITGIFIQFENAMNVGDVVTAGGTTGTVERLTIRSVSLRDVEGIFHIIPFSSVDMVSNYMREFGNFVCDMGIAYRESIDDAKQAMLDAFEELRANPAWKDAILGDLQWFGLQRFGDSAVVVRARIKCIPGQQWAVGRAYNEVVKRIFDERGIEIPFPHQTIYFGEDKQGTAPPARVLIEEDPDRPDRGSRADGDASHKAS